VKKVKSLTAASYIDAAAEDDDENASNDDDDDAAAAAANDGKDDAASSSSSSDEDKPSRLGSHRALANMLALQDEESNARFQADKAKAEAAAAATAVVGSPISVDLVTPSSSQTARPVSEEMAPPPPVLKPANRLKRKAPPSPAPVLIDVPADVGGGGSGGGGVVAPVPMDLDSLKPVECSFVGVDNRVPTIDQHIFGSDGLDDMLAFILDDYLAAGELTSAEEMAEQCRQKSIMPSVASAYCVGVLCRGHLFDQARGLANQTPSSADRETGDEIKMIASHYDDVWQEDRFSAMAALLELPEKERIDAVSYRTLLPFEILLANRCVAMLGFGRCHAQSMGSSVAVQTEAGVLLLPTDRGRSGYMEALAMMDMKLPPGTLCRAGPPQKRARNIHQSIIDIGLTENWRLEAMRAATFNDTLFTRTPSNVKPPAPLQFLSEQQQSFTNAVVAEVTMTESKAQAPPPPPPPRSPGATTKTPAKPVSRSLLDENIQEDGLDSFATAGNAAATQTKQKRVSFVGLPAAATASAIAKAIDARRFINGHLLVRERELVVHNVSALMRSMNRDGSLVPSAATILALEMLAEARADFMECSRSLELHTSRQHRSLDVYKVHNNTDIAFPLNNFVGILLPPLADVKYEGETQQAIDARMREDQVVSLNEICVLKARSFALHYTGQELLNPPPFGVDEFTEWQFVVGHVFTQIGLRLHAAVREMRVGEPAVMLGVSLSTSEHDITGEPITLGTNELPAHLTFSLTPNMRSVLKTVLENYYKAAGIMTPEGAFLADLTPKKFQRLHEAFVFPPEKKWVVNYLTRAAQAEGHTREQKAEFRNIFALTFHYIFQTFRYLTNMSV
jgi:hypothetical protein